MKYHVVFTKSTAQLFLNGVLVHTCTLAEGLALMQELSNLPPLE